MQNTPFNFAPAYLPSAVANILNGAVTSLAGPVGLTLGQPYLMVKHIRLVNVTASAVTASLYKGATGASAGGTQWAFSAVSIPANSYVDWYGSARFGSADFLTGNASAANSVTINIEGEVGFSTA